jgi:hypothetical protein
MPTTSTTPALTTPALTTPAASAVANTHARSARVNRRPHPNLAALKERAFALTCTGLRSPAIALQLGVPERTIRRWVNSTLLSLAQNALDPDGDCDPDLSDTSAATDATAKPNKPNDPDHTGAAENPSGPAASAGNTAGDTANINTRPTPLPLERHRALAIERQLAVAVTANAAYDRLMARYDDLLDALTGTLRDHLTMHVDGSAAPASLPPSAALLTRLVGQLEAGATRHLRIAQAAHRDAARFQGVPAYAQTDARLTAAEAHASATAEPEDDAEQGVHHVPIEWVDPNDPTKVGLVPRNTFDAKAAIDELCNGPTSSLDRLQETGGAENNDDKDDADADDDEDEQDEDAILAGIIAEQVALNSPVAASATSAATVPATAPATGTHDSSPDPSPRKWVPGSGRTSWRAAPSGAISTARSVPATGAATPPATYLDERRSPHSTTGDTAPESESWQSYEQRQRLREEGVPFVQSLSSTRPPPTLPRSNTIAALFLRNPHYVF